MATVHADPESQEKIDDGTAKGGWTWPWILAVVLGLVVVVLLVLWGVGVFDGAKSELGNERIVVLPRYPEGTEAERENTWGSIPEAERAKLVKELEWQYIPQNGRYILINKDDVDKVKTWAKGIIRVAGVPASEGVEAVEEVKLYGKDEEVTIYEPLQPLSFATKDGHADEITTYGELADAMKRLARTVSAIAQHRARLAIKTLKLAADDGKALDGAADSALGKMTPTEEIDEAVKIANDIKADIKEFFEDVLIPTAEKINIAQDLSPEEKAADGTVTKDAVTTANRKDMIVALLKLFVEEGGPIADKFIEMKERIVKAIVEDMSDQKTIADILSDAGKAKALASTEKITKEEKKDDQKAFDDLMDKAFEADNAKFGELRKTHVAVEEEYVREMRGQARAQQQGIVAIYENCRDNIRTLSTDFVKPKIATVFITEGNYDGKVNWLDDRSGGYVRNLIGAQPAQAQPADEPQQPQEPQPQPQDPLAQHVPPPPATAPAGLDAAVPESDEAQEEGGRNRGRRGGRNRVQNRDGADAGTE